MGGAISYLDFDLQIRRADGRYRVEVTDSPAGQATGDFDMPLSELELENFLLRVGRPRRGTRRIGSPEMEAVKALGKRLYEAVFSGEVNACWRSSISEAEAQKSGLRLRLRIAGAPELNDVPWEYLYNPSLNRFLSLSRETPLIRYLDLPERVRPLTITAPLRVLVMIASPSDYPGLDVEKEWARLSEALDILARRGLVTLERLEDARLSVLQRKLRGGEYHVLHFVGHGGFDRESQDGVIILRDETGKGRAVAAQHLGTILHDHRSLSLVVLNACEGSRASRTDPFAGTAQTLVQQGIPAVIAMQFEITDQAAITFAEEFYAATADGYPVDAALAEARKAIFGTSNDIEWGTPVLYLRAPDGQLFVVNRPAPTEAQGLRPSQTEQPAGVPAGAASAAVKDQSAGGTERGPERAAPDRAERVVRGSGPAWFRRRRTPIGLSIAGFLAALALASVVRSVDRTFSLFVLLFALAQIVVVLLRLKWPAYLLAILNAVALAFAIIAVNSVRRSEVPEWLFFVLTVALGGSATSLSAWNRDAPDSTRPKREGREQ